MGFTDDGRWRDELDSLSSSLSADQRTLTITITAITFVALDKAGQGETDTPVASLAGDLPSVGDVFALHFEQPDLIKAAPVYERNPTAYDNPYLCGPQLADEFANLCGA